MLKSVNRIAPSYEEFTSSILHKVYDISIGLNIPIDVTDFSTVNYAEIYHKIVDYETKRPV